MTIVSNSIGDVYLEAPHGILKLWYLKEASYKICKKYMADILACPLKIIVYMCFPRMGARTNIMQHMEKATCWYYSAPQKTLNNFKSVHDCILPSTWAYLAWATMSMLRLNTTRPTQLMVMTGLVNWDKAQQVGIQNMLALHVWIKRLSEAIKILRGCSFITSYYFGLF